MNEGILPYHQTSQTGSSITLQENQIKTGGEAVQRQGGNIQPGRIKPRSQIEHLTAIDRQDRHL